MRIPIRNQFMLPFVAVAIVSLAAVGLIHSRLAARQTKARIEDQLRGVVSVLAESSYPLTDSVLRQMGGLANAQFVLTDAEGKQLASGSSVSLEGLAADDLTARTVEEVALGPELVVDSKPFLHSSVWVRRRASLSEPSVLHILFSRSEFDAAWRSALVPPLLVGAAMTLLVAFVVHLVAGRLSRTLSHLGGEVNRLAEGDFSDVRLPEWNDESRDLALAVNQAAARLADYEAELRRTERLQTVAMLGAGLAHEMRNAATGCRLALDLHAENCRATQDDDGLEVARRQLVLMESRLRQLMHLGKETSSSQERVMDFAQLVSQSVALLQPAARHCGVRLEWHSPTEEIAVRANSELLGQAVTNVLVNALDAAAKGQAAGKSNGMVNVEMRCHDKESELIISDSGEGPAEHLADDAFEPFVTSKPEGVGLGLAVTKRVIESSGGLIGWKRETGLTKFSIRLPRAAAAAGVSHV